MLAAPDCAGCADSTAGSRSSSPQRRALVAGGLLLALLLPPQANAERRVIHKERSLYRTILVTKDVHRLCMQFSVKREQRNQSCKNLRDPKRILFDYAKLSFGSFLLNPQPRSILVVGLGGGTLPEAYRELLPDAHIDVVEIDQAVVDVAAEYFDYRATSPGAVHVQDARIFGKRASSQPRRYDLIVLDAFNGEYIPEHLMTREYLQETRALLAPGGVLLANTFSISRLYHHERATYASVFGDFIQLRTPASSNSVIMVKNGAVPDAAQLDANQALWQPRLKAYDVDLARVRGAMTTTPDWQLDARVLTDQYSPANLLSTR
ncbi:MAG: fused MFS/spermidine synthase [Pseudomonadota bacterium]